MRTISYRQEKAFTVQCLASTSAPKPRCFQRSRSVVNDTYLSRGWLVASDAVCAFNESLVVRFVASF